MIKKDARASVRCHLVKTFFDNSAEQAVAAVDLAGPKANGAELDRIRKIIDDAKRKDVSWLTQLQRRLESGARVPDRLCAQGLRRDPSRRYRWTVAPAHGCGASHGVERGRCLPNWSFRCSHWYADVAGAGHRRTAWVTTTSSAISAPQVATPPPPSNVQLGAHRQDRRVTKST